MARIAWGGPSPHGARDLLAGADDPAGRSERSSAEDWLRDQLAGGSVAVRDLRQEATGAGISWRTVERAKAAVGVDAVKSGWGEGWLWRLRESSKTAKTANPDAWRPSREGEPNGGRNPAESPEDRHFHEDRQPSQPEEPVAAFGSEDDARGYGGLDDLEGEP